MIKLKLLNSQATLNDYKVLNAIDYTPGEEIRLVVKLINSQLDIRFIPDAAATLNFEFLDTDGNTVTKAGTVFADDRSMWEVTLTETETLTLTGGFIKVVLDDNGTTMIAIAKNVLSKILIDGDC